VIAGRMGPVPNAYAALYSRAATPPRLHAVPGSEMLDLAQGLSIGENWRSGRGDKTPLNNLVANNFPFEKARRSDTEHGGRFADRAGHRLVGHSNSKDGVINFSVGKNGRRMARPPQDPVDGMFDRSSICGGLGQCV
jgi:hypothetical protein